MTPASNPLLDYATESGVKKRRRKGAFFYLPPDMPLHLEDISYVRNVHIYWYFFLIGHCLVTRRNNVPAAIKQVPHYKRCKLEKCEYCRAVKWELSLAASKMGETWSDGGPPLLGLALPAIGYCSAEIAMILQSPPSAATSHSAPAICYKYPNYFSGERSLHGYQLPYCGCGSGSH